MRARLVEHYTVHPSPGSTKHEILYERGGLRYTAEQWRIMQFLDRVERKLEKIDKILSGE